MRRLICSLLFCAIALPVSAESILERRYTSAKLDGLWLGTLGAEPPGAEPFEMLAPGPDALAPVADTPGTDFGLPFSGEVIGESATGAGGTVTPRAFPVIPLSAEDAAVLYRRLAWAEIYLTRYRFFEAVSTDGADVLERLTVRQFAAAAEAYLITARQYYAAPDLPEKCARLNRLRELSAGPLSGVSADAMPAEWRSLLPIVEASQERLGDEALANLVCSIAPVRARAETVRVVETRVRERIVAEVRAKVEDTLTLLEAAGEQFQTLVNDMDVPILSAEILELERVLGNSSANMDLVMEDHLDAATTIETLRNTDLSTLNQPGQLDDLEAAQARMQSMVVTIDRVMAAMADLATVVEDPNIRAELGTCETLRGAYSALDLNQDTGTLTLQINGPYEDCLSRARAVVTRFQEPSLAKAMMAELARHVRLLSETYLSTVAQ